ncbi:3'(2'),5'-bisphosphate nucleotidase CysQ [Saccharomonospora saliphila]|uniref:3'(2'),5'-bisphosphate nucleotidase CysQ n=1 Tax=Saccharomonospora saliphila TaxID=369829 RepID=UPI00035EDBFA|nr:3'(2'),5'-bisphosphate nucleotidase CysQ [Saccharomonospora saliphila]
MTPDTRLAARLAQEAGRALLALRTEMSRAPGQPDPRELGRRGDAVSQELLSRLLAEHRPGDAVLSEESADDGRRLDAERVWIVDPLDGTREYGLGRPDWTVHVALWEAEAARRGGACGLTAAAVAQPDRDELFTSGDGPAERKTTREIPAERTRILVSDTRPPEFANAVAESVDADLVPMGSAGAKATAVLRGAAEAYLHAGGQYEWDSAAPVGVVRAAGLHASRIDGTALRYNAPTPYLPDLVICRAELAGPLLDAIATATRSG